MEENQNQEEKRKKFNGENLMKNLQKMIIRGRDLEKEEIIIEEKILETKKILEEIQIEEDTIMIVEDRQEVEMERKEEIEIEAMKNIVKLKRANQDLKIEDLIIIKGHLLEEEIEKILDLKKEEVLALRDLEE